MTTGIETELKELLTKHLPQATSDALQERLRKADSDATLVVTQKDQIGSLSAKITDLEKQLNAAKEELKKHAALAVREAEVAEKERNAEIAALKALLASLFGK